VSAAGLAPELPVVKEPRGDLVQQSLLLSMHGICKAFGGTQALRDVSISVRRGEVLALLGENGAGKSTLIKILAGVHAPDAGRIAFNGCDVGRSVRGLPIAFIHQDLGLIEWMTIAENVCLTRGFARSRGLISWKASRSAAAEALAMLGVELAPDTRIKQLGRTERSLVAIARALSSEAKLIIMDEPTASLPADEVERLTTAIRSLSARGIGVIYVSHRLEEIFAVADRVVVLRDGRVAGESVVANTTPSELVHLIIGRSTSPVGRAPAPTAEGEALGLDGAVIGEVGPLTLSVAPGELVGLTGLRGAGQEVVGRALFGLHTLDRGSIRCRGETVRLTGPAGAIRRGIRFASGDRTGDSVVVGFSVRENFFLNPIAGGKNLFDRIRHAAEHATARELGRYVRLNPNDSRMNIEALSGGNQQKVVIGRWLHLGGKVLVLEDPTAGVDVGAKAEIYRLLFRALESGLAIILISTDFVEVASICTRAFVFSRGRIVRELGGDALTPGALLNAAAVTEAEP
jgi:ribose transport system ATP-binding protein